MNEFSNQTGERYARPSIRRGRHPRHPHRMHRLHRLSHGFGDVQDVRCREHRGQAIGRRSGVAGTGRPGGLAKRGHPGRSGRGRNRRAGYELHKALTDVARTGDEQLRGQAAQILAEATSRLTGLLAADR